MAISGIIENEIERVRLGTEALPGMARLDQIQATWLTSAQMIVASCNQALRDMLVAEEQYWCAALTEKKPRHRFTERSISSCFRTIASVLKQMKKQAEIVEASGIADDLRPLRKDADAILAVAIAASDHFILRHPLLVRAMKLALEQGGTADIESTTMSAEPRRRKMLDLAELKRIAPNGSRANRLFGQWPGTETDEKIEQVMKELNSIDAADTFPRHN